PTVASSTIISIPPQSTTSAVQRARSKCGSPALCASRISVAWVKSLPFGSSAGGFSAAFDWRPGGCPELIAPRLPRERGRESEPLKEIDLPPRIGGLVRPPSVVLALRRLDGTRHKGGHVADLVAAQREDVQREGHVGLGLRVPRIEGERRLPVGAGRDLAPIPLARQRPAG